MDLFDKALAFVVVFLVVFFLLMIVVGIYGIFWDGAPGTVECPDATYTGLVKTWNDESFIVNTESGRVYAPKALCTFHEQQ